jgi:predicted DNA-binding protein with PD1-like motif
MTHRHDGYNWIVRLSRGEKLIEGLVDLVRRQGLPNCWISGMGGAQALELGFYELDKKTYKWQQFEGLFEIVSLQGNIVGGQGEPQIHIHGSFAGPDFRALGGHVKELTVGGTCELLLHQWYGDGMMRFLDESTGLNLLDL